MRSIPFAAALCVGLTTAASAETLIPGVSDLIWFGDSVSDPGNAFFFTGGTVPDPAFFPNGQFSDGDTWGVQLGADFASGTNFAVGAARAAPNDDISPDFAEQIALFAGAAPDLGERPVAVIALGGNDLRDAADADNPEAVIAEAAAAIGAGIETLIDLGLSEFLVANVPSLGLLPELVGTAFEPLAEAATLSLNFAIDAELAGLTGQAAIQKLDLFALFEAFTTTPEAFGLTNTTDACLTGTSFCGFEAAEEFLFYDNLHPTEAAHTFMAGAVFDALAEEPAPVPLPASATLLLLGLAALGMARKCAGN